MLARRNVVSRRWEAPRLAPAELATRLRLRQAAGRAWAHDLLACSWRAVRSRVQVSAPCDELRETYTVPLRLFGGPRCQAFCVGSFGAWRVPAKSRVRASDQDDHATKARKALNRFR